MPFTQPQSDFLQFLVGNGIQPGDRLPPLSELSTKLNVSVSKLREQMEVARMLGLVKAKPRAGIHRTEYSFLPAVRASLLCAVGFDRSQFKAFSELRNQVEAAFLPAAMKTLLPEDIADLRALIQAAQSKLQNDSIQIPHEEHRRLHLGIFRRLENPFVIGLLEAYWDGYEAVQLNLYADYEYLREVWDYHTRIVDCIERGDADGARQAFLEHIALLRHRPNLAE